MTNAESGPVAGAGEPAVSTITALSSSPEATRALGTRIASLLQPGDVICLRGDLGAGKTTLVQGIAGGLGVAAPITSPTFILIHEHPGGRLPLFHFDWYRLRGDADLHNLGFDEYLRTGGVTVIEWPERAAASLPAERLEILLTEAADDENRRLLTLTGHGDRWKTLTETWANAA